MRNWSQNSSLRAIIISSLGFGLASCSLAESSNSNVSQSAFSRVNSAGYAPVYPPASPAHGRYVLHAQNNVVPNLRGLASAPQNLGPQYYQNYRVDTQSGVTTRTAFEQNVMTGRLNHQLDDTVPSSPVRAISQTRNIPEAFLGTSQLSHQLDDAAGPSRAARLSTPTSSSPARTIYSGAAAHAPQLSHQLDGTVPSSPVRVISNSFEGSAARQDAQNQTAPYSPAIASSRSSLSAVSINSSLSQALDQSTRLAIEDLKIQEAEEGLVQAKAQGKFKLNLDSVVGATQSDTVFDVVDRTSTDFRLRRSASLGLSLPLYQGGRIKAQKNVARTGIETAKANYDSVESAVSQETAIAHLNIIRDRQLIQVYSQNVELLKEQQRTVRALVNAGENTLTDAALVEARLAAVEARLEQARASLGASESNYRKLVGGEAPSLLPVDTVTLPASLREIKTIAQQNNPQIRATQTLAEDALHNVAVAKSFGRPKLALQGILRAAGGQSETIRRDTAAELLLNLSVPLLSGGENKSRVRQAALAQSRAMLESRELYDNLNERIEQLWANVQSARRSQVPNQLQKTASQTAYDAIVQQRDAGLATSLDVLTVQQNLFDADINLILAENDEAVSRFQLLGLMGAL